MTNKQGVKKVDTEEHTPKAIDYLRKESQNTGILQFRCVRDDLISLVLTRISYIIQKVSKEVCSRNNLTSVDNGNVEESYWAIKKLHLNRNGTSYLADNGIHDIWLPENTTNT